VKGLERQRGGPGPYNNLRPFTVMRHMSNHPSTRFTVIPFLFHRQAGPVAHRGAAVGKAPHVPRRVALCPASTAAACETALEDIIESPAQAGRDRQGKWDDLLWLGLAGRRTVRYRRRAGRTTRQAGRVEAAQKLVYPCHLSRDPTSRLARECAAQGNSGRPNGIAGAPARHRAPRDAVANGRRGSSVRVAGFRVTDRPAVQRR